MRFVLLLMVSMITTFCSAQNGYKTGDVAADIRDTRILNYAEQRSSLARLQSNITIIDFFGTWCVPCLKALPELESLKTKFKADLNIVLVSTEKEEKLRNFIKDHQQLTLPLFVDENKSFSNAFQPASYPYTVVLDKNLKILLITNASDLTENIIKKLILESSNTTNLKDRNTNNIVKTPEPQNKPAFTASNNVLVKLSQDFMYAAKTNEDASSYIEQLKVLDYNMLIDELKNDTDKKAFWINLYNAFTNSSLHKNPDQYKSRKSFFKNKNIVVAGKTFSLDKIEHGLLRKSKIKWSLGYLNELFPGKTEKQLRVDKLDYRIHFALNCGAKSCPPIAFYDPANLETQLDLATTAYLTSEVVYDKSSNVLQLPALVSWFRRDFGGLKNFVSILKQRKIIEDSVKPHIKFKKYDWSLYLDNFKQ